MTPFLQLSIALAIIIAAAKTGGYISYRLGQPSVLGELLVGVLLGPSVINLLHLPYFTNEHLPETIHEFAEIGVMLLMFIAGLDLHISDLVKSGKIAAFSGVLGVIFPLAAGAGLGIAYAMDTPVAIFLGLILAATSVSISAQTLMELKVLRSRVGISLLGAAVFDDILVVLGLSVFTAVTLSDGGLGITSVLAITLRMVIYLVAAAGIGLFLIPRLSQIINRLPISQGLIAFSLITILLFGWAAEELGRMAAITGAFLAGLMFAQSPLKEKIESGVSSLAYGLFVPIFFINVGLQADARQLTGDVFWLFVILTLVAIVSKILGSGIGARLSGLTNKESLQIGIGMMSRGEVGLIVATVGINEGFIPASSFSVIVGVVILTTLLTPPLLRLSFRNKGNKTDLDSKSQLAEV